MYLIASISRHNFFFISLHLKELQDSDKRIGRNATLLWKKHTDNFADWIKRRLIKFYNKLTLVSEHCDIYIKYFLQIPISSEDHDKMLKWIAYGPKNDILSYKGYIINGQRFHTKDIDRETQNSGVTYDATTMCRASAKDISQVVDVVTYYGILTDIFLLDYHVFYVPIFKCH